MESNGSSSYSFTYKVWQRPRSPPLTDLLPSSRLPEDDVSIRFLAASYREIMELIDGRLVCVARTAFPWTPGTYSVPKHAALLYDGGATMMRLLSEVGIPAHRREEALRDIALVAAVPSTLPIVVTFSDTEMVLQEVSADEESREEMDIVLRGSMDVDLARTTPTTRSSIEQLEKVTYEEGLGSIDECIFCTEEFKAGLELIRLPCSHVYHRDCVVKWLEKSRLCPLCRFSLPATY